MNDPESSPRWFAIENVDEIESPSLLIYPDRVEENIRRMVAIAGDPLRLRPHVKTHKLAPLAEMQMRAGIRKFKAATIAEAEMLAGAGAADVLLAYPPAGPTSRRLLDLIEAFPQTTFSCVVDDASAAGSLSQLAVRRGRPVSVLLDLDCGQHRTGVAPDDRAVALYETVRRLPGLRFAGLHAYDGHIHTSDPVERKNECETAFAPVLALRERLRKSGAPAMILVAGGTPTFPFHAQRPDVECSPGTCVLWDFGYESRYPDMEFLEAALVLTRVVSRPGERRWCLDLGHKAVASESPPPRVRFLDAPADLKFISHSEEHLVVETEHPVGWKVGDCLYGVPWHICPTVALHGEAVVIRNHQAAGRWRVAARDRRLQF